MQGSQNFSNKIILIPIIGYLALGFILLIIWLVFFKQVGFAYNNPVIIQDFIKSTGVYAPLITIFFQILQSVLIIIPGQVFTIISGYLFGTFLGALYSFIGIMLGSIIVFYLGRKFGRPYVEKRFTKEELQKWDNYFEKKEKLGLFLCRLIPFFIPNDLVSLFSSMTKITYKDYIFYTAIGYIPSTLLLTYLGYKISSGATKTSLIILSLLGIIAIIVIFKDIFKLMKRKNVPQHIQK